MQRKAWVAGVLVVVAVLAAAYGISRPPAVPALAVQATPLVRTLQFSARVASASRVELGSTLTGRVTEVAVREGARVRRGQPLLSLETDELRAALAQAEAAEQQAAARLAGLRGSGRRATQAGVAQADSNLAAASAEFQRTQDLLARGFVSQARLDEARRALAVAQAQQAAAQAQSAANAEDGSDIAQAQAQLGAARAATQSARVRLAQAQITAPADARVLARAVEPGQIVQPGRALLVLALDSPLQLVAQVDERFLEQLQPGQSASVLADAFATQRFEARVLSIAPLVDAQRGAVEVKFTVAEPVPAFLREDMTLSVEVQTARRERALALPVAALRSDDPASGPVALLLRDGRVAPQALQLGLRTLDAVEVTGGLAAGQLVLLGPAPAPGRRARADLEAGRAWLSRQRAGEDAGSAMVNSMGR